MNQFLMSQKAIELFVSEIKSDHVVVVGVNYWFSPIPEFLRHNGKTYRFLAHSTIRDEQKYFNEPDSVVTNKLVYLLFNGKPKTEVIETQLIPTL